MYIPTGMFVYAGVGSCVCIGVCVQVYVCAQLSVQVCVPTGMASIWKAVHALFMGAFVR